MLVRIEVSTISSGMERANITGEVNIDVNSAAPAMFLDTGIQLGGRGSSGWES